MRIVNETRGATLADKAVVADTFVTRSRGLLGRQSLQAGEGMLITRCDSVHTFFMRFSIDVIFINRKGIVTAMIAAMKPFRLSGLHPLSDCIELPAGTIAATATQKGDHILISA